MNVLHGELYNFTLTGIIHEKNNSKVDGLQALFHQIARLSANGFAAYRSEDNKMKACKRARIGESWATPLVVDFHTLTEGKNLKYLTKKTS